ncbi:MAG: hypothetical protein QF752_05445 [Planctomycetota bacterium]|jgi:uncharacterized membrane protein|nr:hypothetical protein [Planctomycetota bacterium]
MSVKIHSVASVCLGAAFVWIGIVHFLDPGWFEPIVPAVLGSPTFWVYASGVCEIGLGVAFAIPRTRKRASLGLAALLLALYWANLNMWIHDLSLGDGSSLSRTGHVLRAGIQFLLILTVLWVGGWLPGKRLRSD